MPNDRLERTRASLPEGYQFGDARPYGWQERIWRERREARNRLMTDLMPHVYTQPHGARVEKA